MGEAEHEAWERLQRFESRDYLQNYFEKSYSRKLSASRAHSISSSFTQGREYFMSARSASISVKPLLLYYGASSLARGMTLVKSPAISEHGMKPSHGLAQHRWAETLQSGISAVLKLRISCTSGLFGEFFQAVGNKGELKARNGLGQRMSGWVSYGQIAFMDGGSTLSLSDILSRDTRLEDDYQKVAGEDSNIDFGFLQLTDEELGIFFMNIGRQSAEDILAKIAAHGFPEKTKFEVGRFPEGHPHAAGGLWAKVGLDSTLSRDSAFPMISGAGELHHIIRPFPRGDRISEIHRTYFVSFIIGMLCRYYPSVWMQLVTGGKGDIARSVVLNSVRIVERSFPQFAFQAICS